MRLTILSVVTVSIAAALLFLGGNLFSKVEVDVSYTGDESGYIPIITYHRFGSKDSEFTRTLTGLEHDLTTMHKRGFHFITMKQFLSGRLNVPAGKIPIMITLDDSADSQFTMNADGSIASDCAMYVFEKFRKNHPHFTATFFVLPGATKPNNLFAQPKLNSQKLEYLIKNGYDVESHTLWHANMKKYRDKIEEQLGGAQSLLKKYLPGHTFRALAMPYGVYPPNDDIPRLHSGSYKNEKYYHQMVFDYTNKLSLSVYDKDFNKSRVHRLHGFAGVFDRLFKNEQKNRAQFFISDGSPDVVTVPKAKAGKVKIPKGMKLVTY
ncbi:MAG: polysaccharide deacetylase family protein [Leptospiraceae bacterium]|nr:polysaccharide deacetylase family protein [Leptospiraceae bacterium]